MSNIEWSEEIKCFVQNLNFYHTAPRLNKNLSNFIAYIISTFLCPNTFLAIAFQNCMSFSNHQVETCSYSFAIYSNCSSLLLLAWQTLFTIQVDLLHNKLDDLVSKFKLLCKKELLWRMKFCNTKQTQTFSFGRYR
jgi:hypothetical protein